MGLSWKPTRILIWILFCAIGLVAGKDLGRNSEIIDVTSTFPERHYMNLSADPCDDFYEYTCGNFAKVKPIPEGYPQWEHYAIVQEEIERKCRVIIEEPKKKTDPRALKKAKDMYSACINTSFMNRLGLGELKRLLDRYGGLPMIDPDWKESNAFTWYDIGDIVSEFGLPFLMNFYVQNNILDSQEMVINIDRDGLQLPAQIMEAPESLENFIDNTIFRTGDDIPYVKYLIEMAVILQKYTGTYVNRNQIREEVLEVVEFMKNIKPTIETMSNVKVLPVLPMTVAELQTWTSENVDNMQLDWVKYLSHNFAHTGITITNSTRIYMPNWGAVLRAVQVFEKTPGRLINNFVFLRLLTYLGPETDATMRDAADRFYPTAGRLNYPRWKTCLRKVIDFPTIGMSAALAYEYRKRHIPEETLQFASTLVQQLRTSFAQLLEKNDWMDDDTKALAQKKADAFLVQLGFPNHADKGPILDDYFDTLRICRYDHFGNMNRLRAFTLQQNLKTLEEPRDRSRWSQSSLIPNAYYNAMNNRLTFPIAMMHPPFLGSSHKIIDYGRIGAIIGHEITHAFDNKSKNFDGEGQLTEWWLGNTLAEFNKRAECFVEQYEEKIIPELGKPVPGERTLNENIADNGGLRESYITYRNISKTENVFYEANGERWTSDQFFFISYGTGWCETRNQQAFESYYPKMIHSPGRFRTNVPASNMPQFAEAFRCHKGSPMNPEKRCTIW